MKYFSKLAQLKSKAKGFYKDYYYEWDHDDRHGGAQIAEMVNPRLASAKENFNTTMDEINKLDPSAPDFRL